MLILQEYKSNLGCIPENRRMEDALKYGIAIIDKPIGPTSHEAASFVKKILNLPIVGHTGTLDFNVSGVMVILLENSRKTASFIQSSDKKYTCLMRLGKRIGMEKLEEAFSNFRGEIFQKPPLVSAVSKKLRIRKIHSLEILEVKENLVLFECKCEAGTYIRKIVSDLGEALGVFAEMTELRRTQAGVFSEKNAITLTQLTDYYSIWKEFGNDEMLKKAILPVESLDFKKIYITDESAKKIRMGIKPRVLDVIKLDEKIDSKKTMGIYTRNGELIAIGESILTSSEIDHNFRHGKKGEVICHISRLIHEF